MDEAEFDAVFHRIEAPLRRTLVAWYGPVVGRDATQAAFEWAWTHRQRLDSLRNPAGYLFRVGQSHAKRELRRRSPVVVPSAPTADGEIVYEPGLASALDALSPRQRTAVLLVHGFGYSMREAADVLGVSLGTLRIHLERGLGRLRESLEVTP